MFERVVYCQINGQGQTQWNAFHPHFPDGLEGSSGTSQYSTGAVAGAAAAAGGMFAGIKNWWYGSGANNAGSNNAGSSGLCKHGCGHPVAPPDNRRPQGYDTCCLQCGQSNGANHDPACRARTGTNQSRPQNKPGLPGQCKKCNRPPNPVTNPKTGRPYTTCCWKCANGVHTEACDLANGKTPEYAAVKPLAGNQSDGTDGKRIFQRGRGTVWLIIVLVLLGVAGIGFAVWYFLLRKKKDSEPDYDEQVDDQEDDQEDESD